MSCFEFKANKKKRLILKVMNVLYWLFGFPLKTLYIEGLWEGRSLSDICSYITGVDAVWWKDTHGNKACEELVNKKFRSFTVYWGIILYFASLLFSLTSLCIYCCCFRKKRK